ncbi:hypothetical protein K504DRAFT_447413 [Pleomassaria siparia CBS 279.74]|uniref:VOC domain-containing protein n=1 Tax=Pleomassaria siparia CBS 279.74 TaxID=1314801 RepID=A0A6G1K4P7_9PLEO|nr:hypothetical protein K504DRAFT_447413 [Pleomassaria siparia CBS 279.74]
MPVSHIGLTVSHLPTSCSFFLSALQPLGYRFVGEQKNQIGLGITDADFFLCQETPGVKAGAAHIAFTAPSRTAVRDFYAAALNAGGRPNGAPAARTGEDDHFNAAVLDLDGNSIEVVFSNKPDCRDDGTVIQHSRVMTWRKSMTESYGDDRTAVSARTSHTASRQTPGVSKAPSVASMASMAATMVQSVSAPDTVQQAGTSATKSGDGTKTLIGTLLGAAAGAAVAYAMCKSEQDSAKKESEFIAFKDAQAHVAHVAHVATVAAQAIEHTKRVMQTPQYMTDAPQQQQQAVVHRNINDDAEYHYAATQPRSVYTQQAIEAAPPRSEYSSVASSRTGQQRQIEYTPAHSTAPSQSQFTALQRSYTSPEHSIAPSQSQSQSQSQFTAPQRSLTNPDMNAVAKTKSTVSRVHSVAPSSLISSYVGEQQPSRRNGEGSVYSHHSSKSKAKSSAPSHVSKHSSHPKHTTKSHSRAPSPPPSTIKAKAQSVIGSILGRDPKPIDDDLIEDFDWDWKDNEYNDTDSVAPSDSISNAGSHRSHRRRKSKSRSGGSEVSKYSSSSERTSSSKHTIKPKSKPKHASVESDVQSDKKSSAPSYRSRSHSHSQRPNHGNPSPLSQEVLLEEHANHANVMSAPSDAGTLRPVKSNSRKDSLMAGQYDNLFNGATQHGTGSVAGELPIRGITQSMIDGETGREDRDKGSKVGMKNPNRSMINYSLGQKMKVFE